MAAVRGTLYRENSGPGPRPGFIATEEGCPVPDETEQHRTAPADEEVTDRILTAANVISFVRLCLSFVALALLLQGDNDILAAAVFAVTALTDCLDGQVARRTHTVSKLGQLLDPAVDRVLMICAVVGLLLVGRLPLWVVVVVVARDALMLVGGAWLLSRYHVRIPVVYAGKVATTFLFIGMAGLILNVPLVPGLGLCDAPWLPGFNSVSCSWAIWAVYLGLALALATTVYYVASALRELRKVRTGSAHEPE